jgi:hypothetical protein
MMSEIIGSVSVFHLLSLIGFMSVYFPVYCQVDRGEISEPILEALLLCA